MKILKVKDKEILLDDEDWDWIKNYNWNFDKYGYCRNHLGYLHRLIINAQKGQIVDHIDRNKLNNQRSNLRFVTKQENALNKSKQKNTISKYFGLTKRKKTNT